MTVPRNMDIYPHCPRRPPNSAEDGSRAGIAPAEGGGSTERAVVARAGAGAVRPALVVPNNLHYRVLVVLGSQFAHRGMAGAPPARSRRNGVLIWPAFHRMLRLLVLQAFTHAPNFCKVLLLLEGAEKLRF